MKRRDVAIIGYYETKFERRSGRSIFDVAVEDVRIGMPVRARYERLTDDISLVQFAAEPSGEASPRP